MSNRRTSWWNVRKWPWHLTKNTGFCFITNAEGGITICLFGLMFYTSNDYEERNEP